MKSNKIFLCSLMLLILLGAVSVWYYSNDKLNQLELPTHKKNLTTLSNLIDSEGDLSTLSLRSHLGMELDYDFIANKSKKIDRLRKVVEIDLSSYIEENNEIFLEYVERSINKKDAVEEFKSANSILRNSVNFLPSLSQRVYAISRENDLTELTDGVIELGNIIDDFTVNKTAGLKTKLLSIIPLVENQRELLPDKDKSNFDEYINHVRKVADTVQTTNIHLTKISNGRTMDVLSKFNEGYIDHVEKIDATAAKIKYPTYIYIVASLFLLGALAIWSFRLEDNLNIANIKNIEIIEDFNDAKTHISNIEKKAYFGDMMTSLLDEKFVEPLNELKDQISILVNNQEVMKPLIRSVNDAYDLYQEYNEQPDQKERLRIGLSKKLTELVRHFHGNMPELIQILENEQSENAANHVIRLAERLQANSGFQLDIEEHDITNIIAIMLKDANLDESRVTTSVPKLEPFIFDDTKIQKAINNLINISNRIMSKDSNSTIIITVTGESIETTMYSSTIIFSIKTKNKREALDVIDEFSTSVQSIKTIAKAHRGNYTHSYNDDELSFDNELTIIGAISS